MPTGRKPRPLALVDNATNRYTKEKMQAREDSEPRGCADLLEPPEELVLVLRVQLLFDGPEAATHQAREGDLRGRKRRESGVVGRVLGVLEVPVECIEVVHPYPAVRLSTAGEGAVGPHVQARLRSAALVGSDPLAVKTLRLWLECYGAFAGDLALHWLARGGVYLAGGIAARLMPHTDTSLLINAFLAKREHRELVQDMPVYLLTAEDLGLRGALALAAASQPEPALIMALPSLL